MSKDPAFLFYPGDYLKDTQILSEAAQVAYDRIMCEHMRNICLRQHQLNFLTKRLDADEKQMLMELLTEVEGGYQIAWVAESIEKRKAYSESRRKNRKSHKKKKSESYVPHMENAIENEEEDVNEGTDEKKGVQGETFGGGVVMECCQAFKEQFPDYPWDEEDVKYVGLFIRFLKGEIQNRNKGGPPQNVDEQAKDTFIVFIQNIPQWWKEKNLEVKTLYNYRKKLWNQIKKNGTPQNGYSEKFWEAAFEFAK